MQLNERKLKILQAIIQDYIYTAEPVGSRSLSKKYDLQVSPATIRNEMADLEDMGYLIQPYTSAGRIPSDKGYRLYVDHLLQLEKNMVIQRDQIRSDLLNRFGEIEQLLQYSSKILSQLTNYTTIALAPQIKEVRLKHIQLIPMDEHHLLGIIITDTGLIKKTVLQVPEGLDAEAISKISEVINGRLQGVAIKGIPGEFTEEFTHELEQLSHGFDSVIPKMFQTLEELDKIELFLHGTTNIFNFPEFNDIFKAKSFLSMLEEKELISQLILSSSHKGMNATIGSENIYKEAKEYSLVTATYKIDEDVIGFVSIIGPTRMDYSNVMSTMGQVNKYINEVLKGKYK
ncbi:heat-inducible transcription repressor HrcA [Alkaliphilus metalliredigens QYMF]|uniref:Heat-inducible transcription repressor HrcA n=2 Tax=Alkaliphilus TaxID=114627 RepID=HRCA_ALKMQ|nr:RecName: Full=Heat-inducible transcription repressor HrcA [Alkaliphilus metalliredigens QYMF]ABR49190.1 heat-inducible transcription repressor HrcA [Alkaliphilus metalliredigens QYMF]